MAVAKKRPTIKDAGEIRISADAVPFIPDHDAPRIFASSVRAVVSTFDFVLLLGQFELSPDGSPQMREVGSIFLSPGHAKALAQLLTERVKLYEQQFGELSLLPRKA